MPPSNADLQRQILESRQRSDEAHKELQEQVKEMRKDMAEQFGTMNEKLAELAPIIASNRSRLDFIAGAQGDQKGGELRRIEGKVDGLSAKLWATAFGAITALLGMLLQLLPSFGKQH